MSTTIKQTGAVEYELEIQASKEQLDPLIKKALTKVRPNVQAKGFRKGKVPLGMVKKMYGDSVAMEAIHQYIQENYESEVLAKEDLDVLGRPIIDDIEYKLDQDLKAVVKFGVRPSFILADAGGQEVEKPMVYVREEEVDKEIEIMREQKAEWVDHTEEINALDKVTVTMCPVDPESGEVNEGEKQEGLEIALGDGRLQANIKDALVGKKIGDKVEVKLGPANEDGEIDGPKYSLEITGAQHQEKPPLDDAFAKDVSEGAFETLDSLEEEVKKRIQEILDNKLKETFEENIVTKMIELNPMEIPSSAVALYLDSFVEDIYKRNNNSFPDNFNEESFRAENEEGAQRLVHWMIIKDKILDTYNIQITDEDLTNYLTQGSQSEEKSPEEVLSEFRSKYPHMIDQVNRTISNQKVFDSLKTEFTIVEKELVDDDEEVEQID